MALEFPRMGFAGNSSHCIKTEVAEGHDYDHSLPVPILGSFLPYWPKRSTLPSVRLAAICNAGRILMQNAA